MSNKITPDELLVKCLAMRKGDQWVGICLNFDLAAQADTLNEVKALLDSQIKSYIHDAIDGADKEHAEYLFTRKAPFKYSLMYSFAKILHHFRIKTKSQEYRTLLPMTFA